MTKNTNFIWIFYFLLKLYLFLRGAINLDIILNLLFLAFVTIPAPERVSRYRLFRLSRGMISVVLAFLLLWYDSWLPPILESFVFLNQQGMPSFEYIISFIGGFFNMSILLVLTLLLLSAFLVRKYEKVTTGLLAALIITVPLVSDAFSQSDKTYVKVDVPPREAPQIDDPAKYLEWFYSTESERVIIFKQPDLASPPFDIVILHICSISWDDIKEVGMTQNDPFFKQFDYLFTNFNTVSSYSNPAVMRLFQANCGQRSHREVHNKEVNNICLLFESLESVGYVPNIAMNFDGKYGDFNQVVREYMGNNAIVTPTEDLSASAKFYDKSDLYSDYSVLKKWFDARNASKSEKAALYYNGILLHAGSRWVDEKQWWRRDPREQYEDVLSVSLRDIKRFIDLLKTSKRNTVLIFLPEHGRALTGSPFQATDLRDIPLPKITLVPVGVKLIGPKFNDKQVQQHVISKPTSYLAISWLLAKFVENSPFGNTAMAPDDIVLKIPKTDFVSEHEGRVIIELGGNYLFFDKHKKWITLTPEQLK